MPPKAKRPSAPRTLSSNFRLHKNVDQSKYGTFKRPDKSSRSRSNQELEHLLEAQHDDEEHADSDGLYPPHCCWTSDSPNPPPQADPFGNNSWPVYENIHRIRREIVDSIDDPYSIDQLKAPRMNISVVRPLVDQFYNMQDLSIVYCLLVNRMQFIREQSFVTHHQTVNLTRALLCEVIAEKILRRYNEHNPGPKGLLKLANIVVGGFEPFQKAPPEVVADNQHAMHWAHQKKGGKIERKITALEIAIVSESKSFLASNACQKVVDAIYRGKIVYTPNSFIDIIPDHWKRRPISLYDPRRAPLLNQYRLIVPRTRNAIEIGQFIILLVLYVLVLTARETRLTTTYTVVELVFDVYTCGWILDQFASILEHGWQVYTQNLWSFLDVMFSGLFIFYLVTRIHSGLCHDPEEALTWARLALDALSCAAPVLIPRLAFNVMSENMLFLALRGMMSDFLRLVLLAMWCFIGFLLSLKWLHNGAHESLTIGKWMIWIWFGLDGTGIGQAGDFHWFLGPILMILFAFLGNTLFLTILISMLSNTFSTIAANSVQEVQYRRSVLTFEAVKSDAIFAYMPPFNILALLILLPLKFIVSERWFHKINVSAVKVLNLPLLLILSIYERRTLWMSDHYKRLKPKKIDWKSVEGPRVMDASWWHRKLDYWDFSRFSVHGDIQAVFDNEPPPKVLQSIAEGNEEGDEGIGSTLHHQFHVQFGDVSNQLRKASEMNDNHEQQSDTDGTEAGTRKHSEASDALRREFADSEDDAGDESTHPGGYKRNKRPQRKDSIISDFEHTSGMVEANEKLQTLEQSVQRLEELMLQLLDRNADAEKVMEAAEADLDPDLE